MRSFTFSGRLESRVRISSGITYNNFPFPALTKEQVNVLEKAAAEVLAARKIHQGSSLADLYSGTSMPKDLSKAHENLDKLVLQILGIDTHATESQILASLFALYCDLQTQQLI